MNIIAALLLGVLTGANLMIFVFAIMSCGHEYLEQEKRKPANNCIPLYPTHVPPPLHHKTNKKDGKSHG